MVHDNLNVSPGLLAGHRHKDVAETDCCCPGPECHICYIHYRSDVFELYSGTPILTHLWNWFNGVLKDGWSVIRGLFGCKCNRKASENIILKERPSLMREVGRFHCNSRSSSTFSFWLYAKQSWCKHTVKQCAIHLGIFIETWCKGTQGTVGH